MTYKEKYESLLEEHEALEERYEDLLERVGGLRVEDGKELALAVVAFAEWQVSGYETSGPTAFDAVSRQLWSEVAERVHSFVRTEPSHPCPRPQGDRGDG